MPSKPKPKPKPVSDGMKAAQKAFSDRKPKQAGKFLLSEKTPPWTGPLQWKPEDLSNERLERLRAHRQWMLTQKGLKPISRAELANLLLQASASPAVTKRWMETVFGKGEEASPAPESEPEVALP